MWVSVSVSSVPSASPTAVTVTVCSASQVVVLKVSVLEALRPVSVRSVSAWPVMVTVTAAVGWVASFTV